MSHLPELHKLRIFLMVGSTLSFRFASEKLFIAQPAVSKAIKSLEAELGFQLLHRTTRQVSLTPAGEGFLRDVQSALSLLEHSVRVARQTAAGNAGTLLVGYCALATHGIMAELIIQYRTNRPDVKTDLFLLSSREQSESLVDGSIDCGLLLTAACSDHISHRVVSKERIVALVASSDPISKRKEIRLEDLANRDFIMGRPDRWSLFRSIIDSICIRAGFIPNVIDEADDVPILLKLISIHQGVSLYGSSICNSLPPEITAIPVSDPHAGFEISIAWSSNRTTLLAQQFVEFVKSHF